MVNLVKSYLHEKRERRKDKEKLRMLARIKSTGDGMELIKYLEDLSVDNYLAWKNDESEMNDIHKGYAMAIDNLLESFAKCDQEVKKVEDVSQAFV